MGNDLIGGPALARARWSHPTANRSANVRESRKAISTAYSMPSFFWISSSGTPLVSGMIHTTHSNCKTIITP